MNRQAMSVRLGLAAAVILILAGGCATSSAAQPVAKSSPVGTVHSFAGGCAGTVLTDAEPPVWAQGGWTVARGESWPVPWALGSDGDTVAYLFGTQLVAGTSPRVDGSQNKVLWVAKDDPSGENVLVEGRPVGQSQPLLTIAGGPSIVDVPMPGCWRFKLSWNANGRHSSIINLQAFPVGTNPNCSYVRATCAALPSTPASA